MVWRRAISGLIPALAELAPVLVVVIATIRGDALGRRLGLPTLPHTGGIRSISGISWVTSVAVAASERPGERDPRGVDQEVVP